MEGGLWKELHKLKVQFFKRKKKPTHHTIRLALTSFKLLLQSIETDHKRSPLFLKRLGKCSSIRPPTFNNGGNFVNVFMGLSTHNDVRISST